MYSAFKSLFPKLGGGGKFPAMSSEMMNHEYPQCNKNNDQNVLWQFAT